MPVTHEALDGIAEISGVMAVGDNFLPCNVRRECERVIPNVENVEAIDAADTYLFLKANYQQKNKIKTQMAEKNLQTKFYLTLKYMHQST